jgi:hypothetical protein
MYATIDNADEFEHALALLYNGVNDKLECVIDGANLLILRDDDQIFLRAHLPGFSTQGVESLRQILQLGLVSAFHYDAGLACMQDHSLWLTRTLRGQTDLPTLSHAIEQLLEQRDVWRDSHGMARQFS